MQPEERLTVSEWSDKYRHIAEGSSPEPGRYRTSRTPYLKAIMDALSNRSTYEEIVFMKASQIGASEVGFNWIGYTIDISPAPMLAVMPTEGQMKRNSKIRIEPMIQATPRLRAKIGNTNRDGSNTILQKDFPGGFLAMVGANSATGLRSIPAERLMLDEVDGYPVDLDGEGSPVELARARTQTFKRSKIYMPSTPTVAGVSYIDRAFERTDKRRYFVPCPHCGSYQHLEWEQMGWEGDDYVTSPATAYYGCIHCGDKIYEKHKSRMLAAGEWRATDESKISKTLIGFHVNSFVSPFFTWAKCVERYLKARGSEVDMIAFTNTVKGEVSKPSSEAPNWQLLYHRAVEAPKNRPSNQVKFITMGVDLQKDRLELHIVGWGHDRRRWVIDYRVLPGDPTTQEPWEQLRSIIIGEKFIREDGLEMTVRFTAVDAGNWASEVYLFCKDFERSQVVPVKGYDHLSTIFGNPTSVNKTEAGKNAPGVMLYPVGASMLKRELYGQLKLDKLDEDELGPKGYVHLLKFEDNYFRGLVAEEERLIYTKKNYDEYQWYKVFQRNEPLDTMNYARAAAAIIGMDRYDNDWMDEIEQSYYSLGETTLEEPKVDDISNLPGGFWNNR